MELRLLQGTRSTSPELDRPIAPASTYPPPPEWFTDEARSLYFDTVRRLGEINVASEVDTDYLLTYVQGVLILRDCERSFMKVGVARSRKHRMWETTHRRVHTMARELGLTPAARSGMRIKPNEVASPVKELFA